MHAACVEEENGIKKGQGSDSEDMGGRRRKHE